MSWYSYVWVNNETGEMLTYEQLVRDAQELYGLDTRDREGIDSHYILMKMKVE